MSLKVNQVRRGDALVILRSRDVLVHAAALRRAGVNTRGGRRERLLNRFFISLASLAPEVVYRTDMRAIALHLTVKPSRLPTRVIDLRRRAPADLVRRQNTAVFFNYSLQTLNAQTLSSFNELGISSRDVLLYSSLSLASETWLPVRGLTHVTIDQPQQMRRWIIGDAFSSTGALGGGVFIGGLTLARNFAANPYFIRHPMLKASGVALTPSTLEVYVNNRLVRREKLQPGSFRVNNLPVTIGSGSTRYVVKDAFGRQTSASSSYYFAPRLLAKGVHDYNYSFGLRRANVGTESFDYGLPALLGRHRLGLTNWLTGEARIECDLDTLSGGLSLAFGTPAGQVDLSLAASVDAKGAGVAGYLAYTYRSRIFSAGVHLTAMSNRYATLSLDAQTDRAMVELGTQISVSVGKRLTLRAAYGYSAWSDRRFRDRLEAQASARVHQRVGLMVTVMRTSERPGRAGFGAMLNLHFNFGAKTTGALGFTQDKQSVVDATVHRPLPVGTGFGYRFGAAVGNADQRIAGTFRYQTSFGRYAVHYDYVGGRSNVRAEAAGGLVGVIGGGLFATRPVHGGFAVIRVPGVKGVRAYLNNNLVGRTDASGKLLITGLLPHYGNRLSINPTDIPLHRSFKSYFGTVATPWRGGAVVTFRARRTTFYRGTVVVRRGGRDRIPRYGQLTMSSGGRQTRSPIGANGEFELENPGPGAASAEILWAGGRCTMALTLPESNQLLVTLGQLRCGEELKPKSKAPKPTQARAAAKTNRSAKATRPRSAEKGQLR